MHWKGKDGNQDDQYDLTMEYPDMFPYHTCNITLLMGSTGYVYMLVSVRDFDMDYIGQAKNLVTRFS